MGDPKPFTAIASPPNEKAEVVLPDGVDGEVTTAGKEAPDPAARKGDAAGDEKGAAAGATAAAVVAGAVLAPEPN